MRHSQVMDDLDSADHHDDSALLSGSPRRPATVQQTAVPPSTVPQTSDGDTTAAAAPPAQSAATAAGNDVTGQQTLTAATVELQPDSPVDADTSADASLAAKMEEVSLQAEAAPKKVLTAAQYARLRMETADASDDDDDEADSEPEEAEDEDDRKAKVEAQNQRMRQQAMLAIQRQRMMKVADGSGNSDAHRASLADLHGSLVGASASSPNLVATNVSPHGSTLSVHSFQKSDTSKDYNEDEDESIPLGILAVHGFPNKRRPPSKLMASSSNPNLTGGPGSVNSDYFPQPGVQAGLPPALPPFARKLPQDPYFGHGLVNQNPREPLAMGRGQQQPTAGLVGVIANEESARAARKRSPMQTQGPMFTGQQPASMLRHSVFGAPSPSQPAFPTGQQQMPPHPAMGQQYPGPDLLSMSTMAQTQMQLLELATKLNQQHAAASQQQPYAGPYGMQVPSAPMGYPMVGGSPMMMNYPVAGQRTMSMVDTSRTPFIPPPPPPIDGGSNPMLRPGSAGAHHAYAASIAPSERSNVGTASRYRPVSMIPSAMQQPPLTHAMTPSLPPGYPSTNTPGQGQGQGQVPVLMAVPQMPYSSGHQASSSVGSTASLQRTQTTPLPPSVSVPGTDARAACSTPSLHASESRYRDDDDEEDDEQAWLKMKQAREQNKGSWKFRRANTASVAEVAS
ncbi:hypothetical protein KEM52_005425 [Ascosphaera acerosa]|nr:hypothetical protein KEM52_005425 [Ascosphaera acerosa]